MCEKSLLIIKHEKSIIIAYKNIEYISRRVTLLIRADLEDNPLDKENLLSIVKYKSIIGE